MNTSSELSCDLACVDPTSESAAVPAGGRPVSVWLVDDNGGFRNVLAGLLKLDAGIQCERDFASAEAALAALDRETAPDVILLDVNLGQMNGVDAIQPIRARAPATQVLMLTTFFDSKAQSKALSAGACGFLLKSYSLQEILQSVLQAHREPVAPALELLPDRETSSVPEAARGLVTARGLFRAKPTLGSGRPHLAQHRAALQGEGESGSRSATPLLERGLRRFRALVEATGPWSRTAVE